MKAWCVKFKETLLLDYICRNENSAAVWARDCDGIVVPVEITEIAEDKVESKEPDYKAMWDELFQIVEQETCIRVFFKDMKRIEAKHTPREKTAEEKLAEIEKRVSEALLLWSGWTGARNLLHEDFLSELKDLCK